MRVLFDFDGVGLRGTARQRSALPSQWVSVPTHVRERQALEALLRRQEWGRWIAPGELAFVRDGGEVKEGTEAMVGADKICVTLAEYLYRCHEYELANDTESKSRNSCGNPSKGETDGRRAQCSPGATEVEQRTANRVSGSAG